MPVINRIGKVMKRNRALVTFDQERIFRVIRRAADSNGGFEQDYTQGINDAIFVAGRDREGIARFLSDLVVICLNGAPHHQVSNFPPTVEEVQQAVLHVLRSTGFTKTADAYECYRWGSHWMREGALAPDQFMRNGYPPEQMKPYLEWNRAHGCETIEGLNEIVRSGKIRTLIDGAIEVYEKSLDLAADKVLARLDAGDPLQMIWVSGPSSSGKTTSTVKLTQRLEKRGLHFLMLNLDDYFWALIEHPTDWINDRNYETPEALDIQLLNEHLKALIAGDEIDKPVYSFKEGRRIGSKRVRRQPDQILLLDCLHGFYPPITEGIDRHSIFRLYIEAMNPVYESQMMKPLVDMEWAGEQMTRFEDVRLLRRMLRDVKHRNHPPLATILHWHYVRAGELFSIIPLKGIADHILNGGMPFDFPALKPFFTRDDSIWPSPRDLESYASHLDAHIRYRRIAGLFDSIEGLPLSTVTDPRIIPGDAVIREFIGGSTIKIPHNE